MPLQGGCDMPLTPTEKIWMDGKLVDWDDARIHVLTHTLHYGLGVFEGIRAYPTSQGPGVFRLTPHIDRLFQSAHILGMAIPFERKEIVDAVKVVVRESGLDGCYIRPLVYLGYGEMGLNPMPCPVNVSVACWPWGAYLGDDGIRNGIRLKVSSWARHDARAMPTAAKATGMYINSSLAKVEAVKAGYDEALLLTTDGHISEGTGENIFVVRKGRILTPPSSSVGALEGITADAITTIARDLGYEVVENHLRRTDLYMADEAFLTGTAAEVVPIASVDDRSVGAGKPGPITRAIQEVFFQAVRGEVPQYKDWVEHVT
jgi:branched-chain amino acid aminotransferase